MLIKILAAWIGSASLSDASRMARTRCRYTDSLTPVDHPTRLTVRHPFGELLESRELAPGADLRGVLMSEYAKRAADGWSCEEPPAKNFAGFFCSRNGLRVLVGISPQDPSVASVAPAGCQSWTNTKR